MKLLIRKAIEEFAKDRTTFLISHSLASIQVADRIVLLNGVESRRSAPTKSSNGRRGSIAGSTRFITTVETA